MRKLVNKGSKEEYEREQNYIAKTLGLTRKEYDDRCKELGKKKGGKRNEV